MSVDDPVYSQPEVVGSKLITTPGVEIPYTARRETDARGALLRGLREYLRGLRAPWHDGNELRLLQVREGFAEPEQVAEWPSACVYTEEPGEYDADSLSTRTERMDDGRVLQVSAGLNQNVVIDIWCSNPQERMAIIAMLEDALDPVDWMTGFHLSLPHYFNVVATYLKTSINVVDSPEGAAKRWRLATITIAAACPQLRLVGERPGLDPRVVAQVVEQ